jgi:hypothetical protein
MGYSERTFDRRLAMPELHLVVDSDQAALPLDLVVQTLTDADRILADVEHGVSRLDVRIGEVLIEHVSDGSVALQLRYQARSERHEETVDRASRAFIQGLAALRTATTPPPFFSSSSLQRLRRITARLKAVPGARLVVSNHLETGRAVVDARLSETVEALITARHEALGSIMGTLEAISIHGRRVARVYPDNARAGIECLFPQALTTQVASAFGQRVIAAGVIHRTATGDPIRIELQELTALPNAEDLPSIDDIVGIDPAFTDGLTGEDYVAQQRR